MKDKSNIAGIIMLSAHDYSMNDLDAISRLLLDVMNGLKDLHEILQKKTGCEEAFDVWAEHYRGD